MWLPAFSSYVLLCIDHVIQFMSDTWEGQISPHSGTKNTVVHGALLLFLQLRPPAAPQKTPLALAGLAIVG